MSSHEPGPIDPDAASPEASREGCCGGEGGAHGCCGGHEGRPGPACCGGKHGASEGAGGCCGGDDEEEGGCCGGGHHHGGDAEEEGSEAGCCGGAEHATRGCCGRHHHSDDAEAHTLFAADDEPSRAEAEPIPAELRELSDRCREYVEKAVGVGLDGTADTLPILDHYLSLARTELEGRPELAPLLASCVGAYVGQLLCEHLGWFWVLPSTDVHRWFVCGRRVFVAVNPVGLAYEALYQELAHDGPSAEPRLDPADRELVHRRLALLPGVPDEEFHLLTTRVEILEIVVAALEAQQEGADLGQLELDRRDYEELLG